MPTVKVSRKHLRLVVDSSVDEVEDEEVVQATRFSAFDPPLSPGYTQGALLAIEMIEELQEPFASDRCTILSQYRPGKFQHDVVAQYLPRLTNSELARGFTSMLSCALSATLDPRGARQMPFTAWLELLTRMSPAAAHAEWKLIMQEEAQS